eukprot:3759551-Pyramimonas_sp.AAC.2
MGWHGVIHRASTAVSGQAGRVEGLAQGTPQSGSGCRNCRRGKTLLVLMHDYNSTTATATYTAAAAAAIGRQVGGAGGTHMLRA